jgi:hypothetical protein
MERMEERIGREGTRRILSSCLRDLEDEWFLDERAKYQQCENFDEYLKKMGQDFIKQLEDIKAKESLFFTQGITDEVIDFIKDTPEILSGVRKGNILYEMKIPYMTKEYLAEDDERMKRYYYCHCPWVRESIKTGEVIVSTEFCNCSAGFHKKPYEVIFEQPLEAELIETVLAGDSCCRFAIRLPEEVI